MREGLPGDTSIITVESSSPLVPVARISILREVTDFSRNYFVTQALIGEFAHALFSALEYYGYSPSEESQKTWVQWWFVGIAATLSLSAKAANVYYAKTHEGACLGAEEKVFAFLSPPFLFFIFELIAGSSAISLGWFVSLSALAWFGTAAFFYSLPSPEVTDELVLTLEDQNKLHLPSYPMASSFERPLNIAFSGKTAVFSLFALFAITSREYYGKTEPLVDWQYGLLALCFIGNGFVGHQINNHPKFFDGYSRIPLKLMEHGSIIYEGMSGFIYLLNTYAHANREFQATLAENKLYSYICFSVALYLGLYSAAKIRFDAEKNHNDIVKIVEKAKALQAALSDKKKVIAERCDSAFSSLTGMCSSGFHTVRNKLKSCCDDVENENGLRSPLVQ